MLERLFHSDYCLQKNLQSAIHEKNINANMACNSKHNDGMEWSLPNTFVQRLHGGVFRNRQ